MTGQCAAEFPAAELAAVNAWMLLRASRSGDLRRDLGSRAAGRVTWQQIGLPCAVIAGLLVALACSRRGLWLVQLGDDGGSALGGRMGLTKLGLVAIAVALTGVATAIAGPISAPPSPLRIWRSRSHAPACRTSSPPR